MKRIEILEEAKKLIEITKKIESKYIEIIEKETKGEKIDSLITELKEIILQEEIIYRRILSDTFKAASVLDYMLLLTKTEDETALISLFGRVPLTNHRIINTLQTNLLQNKEFLINMLLPENIHSVSELNAILSFLDEKLPLMETVHIHSSLVEDQKEITLTLLKKEASLPSKKGIHKNLIASKYGIMFLYKECEKNHINENFEIKDEVYITHELAVGFAKFDKKISKEERDEYLRIKILSIIGTLLKLYDTDYNQPEIQTLATIKALLLRSLLQLVSEETVIETNEEFHEFIDGKEYITDHKNDTLSINLITSSYKSYKEDKTKLKILSLR